MTIHYLKFKSENSKLITIPSAQGIFYLTAPTIGDSFTSQVVQQAQFDALGPLLPLAPDSDCRVLPR